MAATISSAPSLVRAGAELLGEPFRVGWPDFVLGPLGAQSTARRLIVARWVLCLRPPFGSSPAAWDLAAGPRATRPWPRPARPRPRPPAAINHWAAKGCAGQVPLPAALPVGHIFNRSGRADFEATLGPAKLMPHFAPLHPAPDGLARAGAGQSNFGPREGASVLGPVRVVAAVAAAAHFHSPGRRENQIKFHRPIRAGPRPGRRSPIRSEPIGRRRSGRPTGDQCRNYLYWARLLSRPTRRTAPTMMMIEMAGTIKVSAGRQVAERADAQHKSPASRAAGADLGPGRAPICLVAKN